MMNRKSFAVACTVAAMSMLMVPSAVAMAEEEFIAAPYMRGDAWEEVAMTNDDTVVTGINIRLAADKDSEVVGYLYRGGAAWVLNKGEEWTEICSGEITGFVKNEYLVYGDSDDITGFADHYGLDGVTITWDGVKVFAEPDASTEMATANTGDDFVIVEDQGHWLMVEYGEDDGVAYLSREDVTFTVLLETAYDKDNEYDGHHDIAEEHEVDADQDYDGPTYTPSTSTGNSSSGSSSSSGSTSGSTSTGNSSSGSTSGSTSTGSSSSGSSSSSSSGSTTQTPSTEAPSTEAPSTETPSTEAPSTEAPSTEAPSTEDTSDDVYEEDGDDWYYEEEGDDYIDEEPSNDNDIDYDENGWYDADTDTWYDGDGNVVTGE